MANQGFDRFDDEATQLVFDWYMWWWSTDHDEMPPSHIYARSADLLARQGVVVPMSDWARSVRPATDQQRPPDGP